MSSAPVGAITLRAPAKLNLGLRLLGRRPDGYHLIESLFAPIELFDELEIELVPGAPQIELAVEPGDPDGLPPALTHAGAGPDDLAFRAARCFCQASGLVARIRIRLRKRIPAAAGLGGGSSDAAAVLNGLAALAGEEVAPLDLVPLAADLGADVPFFLDPRPAHVSGIGERIAPVEGLPGADLVVANPGISLATADVYRAADAPGSALTPSGAGSTMRAFSRLCGDTGGLGDEPGRLDSGGATTGALGPRWDELLVNDLEPAAIRLCPEVARWLDALRDAGAVAASMTGSGATVFGLFETAETAHEAARELGGSRLADSGRAWIRVSRLIGLD